MTLPQGSCWHWRSAAHQQGDLSPVLGNISEIVPSTLDERRRRGGCGAHQRYAASMHRTRSLAARSVCHGRSPCTRVQEERLQVTSTIVTAGYGCAVVLISNGENATAPTSLEWPSSLCSDEFHSCCTSDSLVIQLGTWFVKLFPN